MCLMFHIRVIHFFGILKKKSVSMKYVFFRTQKNILPGLPRIWEAKLGVPKISIPLKIGTMLSKQT